MTGGGGGGTGTGRNPGIGIPTCTLRLTWALLDWAVRLRIAMIAGKIAFFIILLFIGIGCASIVEVKAAGMKRTKAGMKCQ